MESSELRFWTLFVGIFIVTGTVAYVVFRALAASRTPAGHVASGDERGAAPRNGRSQLAAASFVCAACALAALGVLYWMWIPSIILGAAAIGLGVVARPRTSGSRRDLVVASIAVGAVALLFTPVLNIAADDGFEWGQHCAAQPSDPNCEDGNQP